MDLRDVKAQYLAEYPIYEEVAIRVRESVVQCLADQGIRAECSCRAKDPDSLIGKILSKHYDSLDRVTDRAGVRVVLARPEESAAAVDAISNAFDGSEVDNKTEKANPNEFGYRGCHIQVRMGDRECEIQVRSRAENLWNDISHELLYKAQVDVPDDAQRKIFRLAALVELIDEELIATRKRVEDAPGGERWRVSQFIEGQFIRLNGHRYERDVTFEVVGALMNDIPALKRTDLIDDLEDFIRQNEEKVTHIYQSYSNYDGRPYFLNQPESLLVWYLCENDPFVLEEAWNVVFDPQELNRLASLWGISLGDTE